MTNLLKRPKDQPSLSNNGRYERFYLTENPFPTEPAVNKDSSDRRINGNIYESEIRTKEYSQIESNFLTKPQSEHNRLRLGYICDTSYIGRGNGKSAFLVNLAQRINKCYCLDISKEINKCFAILITPEPGGRTKTFYSFLDLIFGAMRGSKIIDFCLATLRFEIACNLYPEKDFLMLSGNNETVLVENLNSQEWLEKQGVELQKLSTGIAENKSLQMLPQDFPLVSHKNSLFQHFVTSETFVDYYEELQRTGRDKHDFLFSHMVHFFIAAGFNGAYILVDDFERIPDFQTGRQKKDFAIELRTALLDGPYVNARIGFYNMLLVLHAGVPQLIMDAWSSSGLGNRYPITPKIESAHWIAFGKLTREHVSLLLKKYLTEYRTSQIHADDLFPFTPEAISVIAEINENNAAKILHTCWNLLDKAADEPRQMSIDEDFVRDKTKDKGYEESEKAMPMEDPDATDLMKKATEGQ
jgi:hypothetical protein